MLLTHRHGGIKESWKWSALVMLLEMSECGSFSLGLVWQRLSFENDRNIYFCSKEPLLSLCDKSVTVQVSPREIQFSNSLATIKRNIKDKRIAIRGQHLFRNSSLSVPLQR